MHTGEGKTDWSSKFCKLGIFPLAEDRFNKTKVTTVHEKMKFYVQSLA